MSHKLTPARICWLVPCMALLCGAGVARAGVAFSDTLSSPLSVAGDKVVYSVNPNVGVSAAVAVPGTEASSDKGGLQSIDFNAAATASAAGSFGFSPTPVSGPILVPGPPPIPGDVNLDDCVDLLDWLTIQINFFVTTPNRTDGDLNGDGIVDLLDWVEVQLHFGECFVIPEPTSLVVFGGCLGLGLLLSRRRGRKTSTP